jgi:Ca-activated chloride channel family protein
MTDVPLHFASPAWSVLLWAWLAFTALLVALERRGSGALDRIVASALQGQLVERPADWRRWLRIGLLSLAGLFMVLALMRPQWGLRFVATPRVGAEIMIALDVSRSMLADDAKPSRLERAKAEIADLLSYLEDDQIGLIAFAGRASVLSPMTPDRSFLRLVLDGAGPGSVSRGGTNLAEPILRAVKGLGPPGPAQRALILITDGEDHDSFALDAAAQAAEAGIKIITIGFGDEAGSNIYVTDPRTGARSLLRDAAGEPVVSRLDGDLLREIALRTDGAYVPAGTGVLDLASIYREHIAGLTRSQLDARGRSIRDEVYGWFVLLALVCLVSSAAVAAGRGDAGGRSAGTGPAALALALALGVPTGARAQPGPAAGAPAVASQTRDAAPATPPAAAPEQVDPDETPREQFNRATEALGRGEASEAEALLREARRRATDDPELRYAATYNLGMAAAARAEAIEPGDPRGAIDALYEAADWFRDATAQHPDDDDPRHNLEIALRKALILADFLSRQDQRDIATELDALLGSQRQRVAEAAGLLEQVASEGELDAAERMRPAFAAAATDQRTLLADASDLAERAARERDAIAAMSDEERSPEDAMRGAQLEAMLHHLDGALDRMGQARSQLRRRSAERAYRRSAAALAELSRARDQLRDPVEQIDVLLAEVARLVRASTVLAAEGSRLPGANGSLHRPAFLTDASARLDNDRVAERVDELRRRFEAGLEAAASQTGDPGTEPPTPEQEALLEAVREATPSIAEATRRLEEAGLALRDRRHPDALEAQRGAGEALAEARERFFDLRQLIEATWAAQMRIATVSAGRDATGSQAADTPDVRDEYTEALREVQQRNVGRGERLDDMLKDEVQQLDDALAAARAEDPSAGAGAPPPPDPTVSEEQRKRLTTAMQLLTGALAAMDDASDALGEGDEPARWPEVAVAAERAADQLEILRTLFFSIVEHVRELARLQRELADRTQDAAALSLAEAAARAPSGDADGADGRDDPDEPSPTPPAATTASGPARGPETRERAAELSPEQLELAERSGAIGDALAEQAEQAASAPPEQAGPDPEESARRLRLAGEHVVSAQLAMGDAAAVIGDDAAPLAPALEHQSVALEELKQALELLVPPEQQQQPEQDAGQDRQPQPREPQQGDEPPEESETPQQETDPAQLLQGVRDREAERRHERERAASRYEPVEKDW